MIRLRVTPKVAGDFEIEFSAYLCSGDLCERSPERGAADQQNNAVTLRTVAVSDAPTPTPTPTSAPTPARFTIASVGTFQFLSDRHPASDAAGAVLSELGGQWRVADWNDIRSAWDIDSRRMARAFDDDDSYTLVNWNGNLQWGSTGRVFFVEDFNGNKPGNFLARDQLGGNEICLGSWFGDKWLILAFRPSR